MVAIGAAGAGWVREAVLDLFASATDSVRAASTRGAAAGSVT